LDSKGIDIILGMD
jgi:hypothetical protein